ncbi:uncharacterized protein [Temnothorax nylanderi]|uniref:uncharacterized protein n=1 Tax=Temnothorax nylanderi TaxID=102681 RepID=UPI003A852A8C
MRLLGIGVNGIQKFCAFMDLPRPIFHSFHDKVVHAISVVTEVVCQQSTKKATQEEKAKSIENNEENGITISGDGTWRKRGFLSLYGLVSLIGWFTGKVIDICVKSKYCKACEFWNKKTDTEEYAEWLETHAQECQANHEGSAGKMEVDAVIEMFQRSETLHSVKYANYIGDGDSKTFKGVLDAQPYEKFTVNKKECIDHVQKRMGTCLRNLKKTTKSLGGKGKLTGKLIDELSIYYGLAIRRNHSSIEKMKNEIWATLFHKLSTDDKPQHEKCPPGENSWCS